MLLKPSSENECGIEVLDTVAHVLQLIYMVGFVELSEDIITTWEKN